MPVLSYTQILDTVTLESAIKYKSIQPGQDILIKMELSRLEPVRDYRINDFTTTTDKVLLTVVSIKDNTLNVKLGNLEFGINISNKIEIDIVKHWHLARSLSDVERFFKDMPASTLVEICQDYKDEECGVSLPERIIFINWGDVYQNNFYFSIVPDMDLERN